MCGICGAAALNGEPVARDAVARACAALVHRGPDHTGTWFDDGVPLAVGLGATRLAILDPQPAGHQPMHSPDGRYHVVFNGEIYNYPSVRDELVARGRVFVTNTDTEVVLWACAEWGTEALARFNGMWAFAFYDRLLGRGFLSRDRFGIKPLFYAATGRRLLFASELPALRRLGAFDRATDQNALIEHLTFGYVAHPRTLYRGARRLPPGTFMRFDADGATQPERFYHPIRAGTDPSHEDYGAACTAVRSLLADSVACRRISDVPMGAFLSGGLDSSVVVAHLAEASAKPVRTFAVGYEDHAGYDERAFARSVAARFATEHHEIVVTEADAVSMVPRVLDHLGEPVGDSSIVPTALLSRFAASHVKVALSGDGGDELFAGYWRYLGHDALSAYRKVPRFVRRGLMEPCLNLLGASRSTAMGNRTRQFQKLLRAAAGRDAVGHHLAWSRILAPHAEKLFSDPGLVERFVGRIEDQARQATSVLPSDDPLNRILAFDLIHQLPADMLQKVDLASMMFSLEVRVPFLDPAVVACASRLPSSFKIDRGRRKRILVDAYRGRLPDPVLDRSKQGFEVPIGEFLRNGPVATMFRDVVTAASLAKVGGLDFAAAERLYQDHLVRQEDHADLLFALLSLCWWAKTA